MDDQSSFTALAVQKILQLYSDSKAKRGTPPTSVVLIGHSIGGVVAKAVFTEPDFDATQVYVHYMFYLKFLDYFMRKLQQYKYHPSFPFYRFEQL